MSGRTCANAVAHRLPGKGPACLLLAAMFALSSLALAEQPPGDPVRLQIIGGLAGITQFTRIEQPFWQSEIGPLSQGRISATIRPLDAGGLRAQEMLQLLKLGVVSFGTVLLSATAGDEPELSAIDLPTLNPDVATLRRTVGAYRPHLEAVLDQRYDIHLLGVYAYPAQVLFCNTPFTRLDDLSGRRIRTSSVAQSELVAALGAVPVTIPFADIVPNLRDDVVDCAITGTLSGYEIGLPGVTSHVHAMALSWGVSIFGANRPYWETLPADARDTIRQGVAQLEQRIWAQAEADTQRGLACNAGAPDCSGEAQTPMTVVPTSPEDEARRRRLLLDVVLPRWFKRCGRDCELTWNTYLKPLFTAEPQTP
ncbi:TRAP transporter substrate-binding protein [Shinella sp. S4-D37]|uniref:TRAP transporter substrate-binding protein n=1 Tax=Shinella sp. S4-D37 TaxID=3161999 RepID=UPI003467074F